MRLSFKVIYLKQETLKNEKDSLKKKIKRRSTKNFRARKAKCKNRIINYY